MDERARLERKNFLDYQLIDLILEKIGESKKRLREIDEENEKEKRNPS